MMNQIVTHTLYRKYRPQSFDEVIGQSEVVETLKKQVESGSIAHAYLFSGGRGTGKTSIARIFARELGTDDTDIYEIDAASNRGINEIRELRDGVANMPFKSQYKVYIIDEVHMLTKEAFNALLKTLEEPPAHAIFILATTEKHKVLDTILSRCQVYDFRLGIQESLVELVNRVVKQEGRSIEDEAAVYIAKLGNGSFRDTLSHLQKALARSDKEIRYEDIREHASASYTQQLEPMLQALSEHDPEALFESYQALSLGGGEYVQLVDLLVESASTAIKLRYSKEAQAQLEQEATQETIAWYQSLGGVTSHTLRDLLEIKSLMLKSGNPRESFEVFLYEQVEQWK